MGTKERPRDPRGKQIHADTRRAVNPSGGGEQITANLTNFGRKFHSITPGDELDIQVHENGIWIGVEGDE